MSQRAAVLGLGERGTSWAQTLVDAGWDVAAFDPDPETIRSLEKAKGVRREATISAAVRGAECIFCCLPERLELVQMVMRRALAEAPEGVIVAISSRVYDVEALQNCTIRPGQVFRLSETEGGGVSLDVSNINTQGLKEAAERIFSELAAVRSLQYMAAETDQSEDAKSA